MCTTAPVSTHLLYQWSQNSICGFYCYMRFPCSAIMLVHVAICIFSSSRSFFQPLLLSVCTYMPPTVPPAKLSAGIGRLSPLVFMSLSPFTTAALCAFLHAYRKECILPEYTLFTYVYTVLRFSIFSAEFLGLNLSLPFSRYFKQHIILY